ncbi:long-chain-fatty-acid--coa ligase [Anaeramoeba flamelloides]|uniref:Long-chain-fatty-acid--coa ligase n=1 Tax=Anaeramoeba flamelloides TaxID=1746091 RepID=A0AAV7Y3C4_9EUKA|nr:long-chain-fatty-acid--coa ligase [Anaeramoeba flamelloides]
MSVLGGAIGYFNGDIRGLADDIAELKPTVMIGVPRVFTRLYDRVMMTIEQKGKVSKWVFKKGYSSKTKIVTKNKESGFWDLLIFKKTKKRLGGKIRLIISGSAPLSKEHHNFLRVCFTSAVHQGYGLTETVSNGTIGMYGLLSIGNCGPPKTTTELKLVDVPEMNYMSENNVGEIWMRGPAIFKGYYKDEKKTKEVLTEDGWFKTGDIGKINSDGTLSIIDRKTNIVKLSNGEFVAIEQLESYFVQSAMISQIWIYTNPFEDFLVAIIVPDFNNLQTETENEKSQSINQNLELKKIFKKELLLLSQQFRLIHFSIPKKIYIEINPFTIESGLLTDTLKYKRKKLYIKYKSIINNMYKEFKMEKKKLLKKNVKKK